MANRQEVTMTVNTMFGSDNHAGVHPSIMAAIAAANRGPAVAYGLDNHTAARHRKIQGALRRRHRRLFRLQRHRRQRHLLEHPGPPFKAVICSEHAHINADECGAPESARGCKLLTVHTSRRQAHHRRHRPPAAGAPRPAPRPARRRFHHPVQRAGDRLQRRRR